MALKSSKIEYGEFLRSRIWADLKTIIKERIKSNTMELEYESPSEDVWIDIRRVASSRARIGELRYLSELPSFLLEKYDELFEIEEEGEEDARTE
ncbi:MAG: hypothetical protein QMD92_00275 [bacterium]|nr:hypothetical protein [bacterium]